ncbi:MAG: hypothetical protein KME27_13135 [Lyngbya sp. HA4199-MV5]|nr:hypothetical protein [Lyngbya sp. HA4199-MV5]
MKTLIYATQPSIQQALSQKDSLIDKGGEVTVYIGVSLIIILIAAIVGMLSQRIEHAVLAALGLSLILIAFFFFTSR